MEGGGTEGFMRFKQKFLGMRAAKHSLPARVLGPSLERIIH